MRDFVPWVYLLYSVTLSWLHSAGLPAAVPYCGTDPPSPLTITNTIYYYTAQFEIMETYLQLFQSIFYTSFLNIKTCSKVTKFWREINVITLQLGDHKFCAQFPLIHIYSKLRLFTTGSHWHLLSVVKSGTMFHTKQFKANFHMTGNIRTILPLPKAQQRYAK